MSKPSTVRLTAELTGLVDAARGDVPRERWVRRALEATLSKAGEGTGPGSRTPVSPAPRGPAASPRAHSNAMCRSCQTLGPPKTRACEKCGHTANPKAGMTP